MDDGDCYRQVCFGRQRQQLNDEHFCDSSRKRSEYQPSAKMTDAGRAYHRRWAQRTFASMVHSKKRTARRRRLTAIMAATDPLVWKLLRRDMQLSRSQAEAVMIEMIEGPPRCRRPW
jgi:hypothetical protein